MPSRQWDYFMENFFGDAYMMWHDGIDPTAACLLEGAERDQAESMLIESMEAGSHYAAMGLRELRSEKAVPVMKRLLEKVRANFEIEIAIALNVIEDTTDYTPHIIGILLKNRSQYVRLIAARKLRKFPTPEAIAALFDAISDREFLVRYNASESLLFICGLDPEIKDHDEIFKLIFTKYDANDESTVKAAAEKYAKATEMLRALFN